MVAPSPVNPVCFEGVAAIGNKERNPPAAAQPAHHFAHCLPVVLHVFQHFVAQDEIYTSAHQGQAFARRADNIRLWKTLRLLVSFTGALEIVF